MVFVHLKQTSLGSGKTLCYVLPSLIAAGTMPLGVPVALVVLPVQTLVDQVQKVCFVRNC